MLRASGSMKSYSMSPLMAPPVPSGRAVQLLQVALGPLLQQGVQGLHLDPLRALGALHLSAGLPQPLLDTCSLGLEDLFQPLVDVLHHRVHVVLLKLVLPSVPQLL